jgi:hypothetical protein
VTGPAIERASEADDLAAELGNELAQLRHLVNELDHGVSCQRGVELEGCGEDREAGARGHPGRPDARFALVVDPPGVLLVCHRLRFSGTAPGCDLAEGTGVTWPIG